MESTRDAPDRSELVVVSDAQLAKSETAIAAERRGVNFMVVGFVKCPKVAPCGFSRVSAQCLARAIGSKFFRSGGFRYDIIICISNNYGSI